MKGTEAILAAVNRCPTVSRVVLTSSAVAVYYNPLERGAGHVFGPADWNEGSTLTKDPYGLSKVMSDDCLYFQIKNLLHCHSLPACSFRRNSKPPTPIFPGPLDMSAQTLAEKKAWEIAGAQSRWSLVVINPTFVMGPPLGDRADGSSVEIMAQVLYVIFFLRHSLHLPPHTHFPSCNSALGMHSVELSLLFSNPSSLRFIFIFVRQLLKGDMWPWAPPLGFGVVDVRDVAAAHLRAMVIPTASGRYILASSTLDLFDFGTILKPHFRNYPLPLGRMSYAFASCVAPFVGIAANLFDTAFNKRPVFDTAKARAELGIDFIKPDESLPDMATALIAVGIVKKR